jgi:hypothetical protein
MCNLKNGQQKIRQILLDRIGHGPGVFASNIYHIWYLALKVII